MVLFGSKIILFGGRSNEKKGAHVPKTYDVAEINGTIEFVTYEESPVTTPCKNNASNCSSENEIVVGTYLNDLWSFDLNCTRYGDRACEDRTWTLLNLGAFRGGCKIIMGRELCTHPAERWEHGAARFDDGTMLVYGGFAQKCEDYCADLWSYDLRDNTWMEIESTTSPGKRWQFSMVSDGSRAWVFGGFRLWHGFADDNSEENRWGSRALLPRGGFLDDLWVYEKRLLAAMEPTPAWNSGKTAGNWSEANASAECRALPGDSWDLRDQRVCVAPWPSPRAGHVAALEVGGGMWVFGGYATHFPYVATDGPGASTGVIAAAAATVDDGFTPEGPYFLDDLWFYNMSTSTWTQFSSSPAARANSVMVFVAAESMLVLFGGLNGSHFFDDTWFYNTTSDRWLHKTHAVYALWPRNCTDDFPFPEDCFELDATRPKKNNNCADDSEPGCPGNDWYEPDPNNTEIPKEALPFYGIVDFYEDVPTKPATDQPIVPYAATGPRQFVTGPRWWNESWLATHDLSSYFVKGTRGTYYRRCTSVRGEPTRNFLLDGNHGRASAPVFIPQPRRRAPGWDGCRDSCFGALIEDEGDDSIACSSEEEDAGGLSYFRPNQRANHAAVYVPDLSQPGHRRGEVYVFGGVGFREERRQGTDATYPSSVLGDMWRLGIHDCAKNCSDRGDCYFGFCRCYPGFYGLDCSNVSCPGDFCYLDEDTNLQVCQHCCQAGYNHTDSDRYLPDVPKIPCSLESKQDLTLFGESNGICDGFGTCQCAPPYVLDDCSVKDCPDDCTRRGYCSVEFPVSRCICWPGYYGDRCQFQHCLNNCSYPNGRCNGTTGKCTCEMMYSPYNNTRPYHAWAGEDCSFLWAYCGAHRISPSSSSGGATLLFFFFFFLLSSGSFFLLS
ncbi:hypothetical protein CTAYLR_000511 [Chrysophaeum taylorii]|uniref:EGF-like domain-containing protein n=1 Tax=Chrysophaeum taylorii TaxID=2483200 RepID=A0AAD7XNK1_9STRA|nr:hypothetical protein CTAYLR_000511 [Chrysophaeum taylorii]